MVENRGRWDAGFRSPLLRFVCLVGWLVVVVVVVVGSGGVVGVVGVVVFVLVVFS